MDTHPGTTATGALHPVPPTQKSRILSWRYTNAEGVTYGDDLYIKIEDMIDSTVIGEFVGDQISATLKEVGL